MSVLKSSPEVWGGEGVVYKALCSEKSTKSAVLILIKET